MKKMSVRFFAAVLFALAATLTPTIRAQDASQVLRLSVGFRTMKNSVPISDEKRKQVEELEAKARAATNSQKYGEAFKHYSHAMSRSFRTAAKFLFPIPENGLERRLWRIKDQSANDGRVGRAG